MRRFRGSGWLLTLEAAVFLGSGCASQATVAPETDHPAPVSSSASSAPTTSTTPMGASAGAASSDPRPQVGTGLPGCFSSPVVLDHSSFKPKSLAPGLPARGPRQTKPAEVSIDDCAKSPQPYECRYDVGRTFFENQQFDLAGPIFVALARDKGSGDIGIYASQLALECMNVIGSWANPARPRCFDEMTVELPTMQKNWCPPKAGDNPETCELFDKISRDLERLEVQRLVQKADGGGADSIDLYLQAGRGYRALADRTCFSKNGLSKKKVKPLEERCDEMLYNAFRAFKAAQDFVHADETRRMLLDPKNGLGNSPLAKKASAE